MGLNAPSTVSEVGKETANLEVRLELRGIYYTLSQIHLAQPCHQKLYKSDSLNSAANGKTVLTNGLV